MGKSSWLILALVSGAMLPIQAGLNARMGKVLDNPVYSAALSFLVGTIALFTYILLTGQSASWSNLRTAPFSLWLGGILGAFYVTATIYAFPKIGPALTFGLVVASQMIVSLLMDHYNVLVAEQHPINVWRVLGVLMIIGGVVLIRRF